MMFNITQGKGFFIEFENGYGISVQFGWGNYCANKETTTFPKDFVAEQVRCGRVVLMLRLPCLTLKVIL